MSRHRHPMTRPTLELLEGRLCLSAAELLPAVRIEPPVESRAAGDYSAVVFVGGWGSSMSQDSSDRGSSTDLALEPARNALDDNTRGTHVAGTVGSSPNTGVADAGSSTGLAALNLSQSKFDGRFLSARDLTTDQHYPDSAGQHEVGHWMALYHGPAGGGLDLTGSPGDPAPARVDYFLRVEDIEGEATARHGAEFEIESWSWGETNSGTYGPG